MKTTNSPLFYLLSIMLIALCSVCTGVNAANSSEEIVLGQHDLIILDKGQLEFYSDKTQTLTFEQIQTEMIQKAFQPLKGNLGLGYIPENVWLKFSIKRQESDDAIRWLEVMPAYLDDIRLFHIDPSGVLTQNLSGDFVPMSQKQENYRGTVFKLDLLTGQHQFYIRLKTSSTMTAVVKLWQKDKFNHHTRSSYFAFGLYFSLILTVFLFTSVNWLVIRQRVFFYYALYLLLNATQWLAINGFVSELFFPEQPLYANLTLGLSLALAAATAYLFYAKVYELKRYHPNIYILFLLGVAIGIITAISVPFGLYQKFAPMLLLWAIITTLVSPWVLVRLWRSKEQSKRLIVVAFGVFSVLLSINILSSLSIIPFSEFTLYIGMLSNLCHILVLHFALMLQIQEREKKYEQAQIDAEIAQVTIQREKQLGTEKMQFLDLMAHEIRTPIAVIDAANESLKILFVQKQDNEEKKWRRFDRISNAVKKLNTVLEMALINTKHESWPFEVKGLNVVELTEEAIELQLSRPEHSIRVDSAEPKIRLNADRQMLRIAMLNIIDNALKYSPDDSPIIIHIEQADYRGKQGVWWLVENQGESIPDDMMNKIFNKYLRLEKSSEQSGMGLGLYLVRNVIDRHQGEVVVENLSDNGTKIGFWLPLS